MELGAALQYPFQQNNILKALTFTLIYAAVIVGGMGLMVTVHFWLGFAALIIGALGYSLALSGYLVRVARSVIDDQPQAPPFQIRQDIGRGLLVMLAGVIYYIPLMIMIVIVTMLVVLRTPPDTLSMTSTETALAPILFACMGVVVALVLSVWSGVAYLVAMVRYAAERRSGALFQLPRNFGLVGRHFGNAFMLGMYLIIVSIIYGMLGGAIGSFFEAAVPDTAYISNPDYLASSAPSNVMADFGTGFYIAAAIYFTVVGMLGIMSQFTQYHLIAGFGKELGYGDARKAKPDDKTKRPPL